MIRIKSLVAASALAVVALASGVASAADVSKVETLSLVSGTKFFGHDFDVAAVGDTFVDRYNFSTVGDVTLGAIVSAFTNPALHDAISISNFQVYNSAGFALIGDQLATGAADVWSAASTGAFGAGNYYVLVTGSLLSTAATSYAGTLNITPVPEPETYAMLAVGLGLIGFAGRRRNQKAKKLG
ncbi:FxDxF family PEP-CTERM protein [Duganella aceris]|uniref:PEP-CTERM sorting domain-containing protein n=1 Tax=Duganella aceris TaxID=2703883 RepID=A0ABX0FV55_9BURK|nr:FxDxF family PEP-CTERM protein [Duganella aceris]NGZ88596.1 PEP-CTERM sorting domain-containing protein [Duganella aceris]